MIEYLIFMGIIWLLLVLCGPLVAHFDAIHACDMKYAADRAYRAEVYEELASMHRQSPLYQRMKEEKKVKGKNRRPSPNNHKARRARKRKPLQEAYQKKLAEQQKLAEGTRPELCSPDSRKAVNHR